MMSCKLTTFHLTFGIIMKKLEKRNKPINNNNNNNNIFLLYLIAVYEVLPFTFALISTPPEAFLLHLPLNELPECLVPLGLCEVLLKLSTNGNKLFGFMVPPLRDALLLLPTTTTTTASSPPRGQ